jgi:outer membrane protein OmpA-like peptidoglycan-associated protein
LKTKILLAVGIALSASAIAQANGQTSGTGENVRPVHTFHVTLISREVQAVNYQNHSGSTKLDFAGTALMPSAHGEAQVEGKKGYIKIDAAFADLQKPTSFGSEYLTYVLWAISPDGRAVNLGEVLTGGNDRAKLKVTSNLASFALIVTAEPYYAVRQPSNVVVLENVVRADTKGTTEAVSAKYQLMERGGYIPTGFTFDPVVLDAKLPLEFFEARNAFRIAQSEGAEQYASESYQRAQQLMKQTDSYAIGGHLDKNALITSAREEVQAAEDAREIAVRKVEEITLADQRQAAADAQAKSATEAANANAQKDRALADAAKAQADMAANQSAAAAAVSSAQADADQARLAALKSQENAQQTEQQAEAEKAALRAKISQQLNLILETRDSARGLIVSMSDVLFDSGAYSLKSGAREKLAKVAGILVSYPGLNIEVDGYTDNVGGDAMNQKLSENRADSVRGYLVQEGVARASVTSSGLGNSLPVASNDSSSGRQQNRRVELVVSGDAIGSAQPVTVGSGR